MRFLLVGEGRFSVYERALCEELNALGHDCSTVGWHIYFANSDTLLSEYADFYSFSHRLSERFAVGGPHDRFNYDVLKTVEETSPDVLFLFNAKQVNAQTVKRLRHLARPPFIVQYNNDNPFSAKSSWTRWRHVRASVPYCDLHLAHRPQNIAELRRRGASQVHLWRSACTQEDLRIGSAARKKSVDVLFAGHYEDDGRVAGLELLQTSGVQLQIMGGGWPSWAKSRASRSSPIRDIVRGPIGVGEYRDLVSRSRVAICFLSSLNDDSYTRRSFEIPALGVAQLSQYTDDLASLFEEDKEIVFFRDHQELLTKTQMLLTDDVWRESVAESGRARIILDGHDIRGRAQQLLSLLN